MFGPVAGAKSGYTPTVTTSTSTTGTATPVRVWLLTASLFVITAER